VTCIALPGGNDPGKSIPQHLRYVGAFGVTERLALIEGVGASLRTPP
jgi:hypothetical protein